MTADVHTLTGAYALDALPEDERREFEAHLEECAACRREVAELRATAARLSEPVEEAPPPGLRDAVLDEVDQTRQERPIHREREARRERSTRRERWSHRGRSSVIEMPGQRTWPTKLVAPAAAVLAVLIIGLSVIVGNLNARLDQVEQADQNLAAVTSVLGAEEVTLREMSSPGGATARIVAAPSRGEAAFFASGMEAAPPDKAYQLWLLEDGQATPAGLFQMGESGEAVRLLTGDVRAADAVAVTVEPEEGSPQPTTEPIMSVEL